MIGYDASMERRLLSNAMERKGNLEAVLDSIHEDDLFEGSNKAALRLMRSMWQEGHEVNLFTMLELHKKEVDELSFGGQSFFTAFNALTLPGETKALIEAVKELSAKRKVLCMIENAKRALADGGSVDAVKALEDSLIDFEAVAERELVTPMEMGEAILEAIEERMDNEKRKRAVLNTSFGKLNAATQGFEKGDLIILSAESGAGKSAFAMNLSKDIAVVQGRKTLYLNSEMSTRQMALRWGSFIGKVSHGTLRSGSTSVGEFQKISTEAEIFAHSGLYTLNIPDLQIESVLSEIRRAKSRYGIELAIVDYIGRMDTINNKDAKEWQVLLNGARRLKTIAQELEIVVIMVAQLAEGGGRLAQGSYMKFETDLWMNICRVKDEEDLRETAPWNCYLEFRKARNASTGARLMMNFYGDTLTFTDDREEAEKYWAVEYPNIPVGFGGEHVREVPV